MEGAASRATLAVSDEDEDDMLLPVNLAAGAIAGLVADCCMHPFDVISTRAKVHPAALYTGFLGVTKQIVAHEGSRGLLAGMSVTLLTAAPWTGIYFGLYETMKRAGESRCRTGWEPAVHFVAGATSELFCTMMFLPFEVVRNRMQLGSNPSLATGGMVSARKNFASIAAGFRHIVRAEGVGGLYSGWRSCFVQDAAFSAIQWVAYEQYASAYRRSTGRRHLPAHHTILAGAGAGTIGALLTNPLDVSTTRQMTQGSEKRFGTSISTVLLQAFRESPGRLWRGSVARVAATAPSSAITFAVYELAKRQLGAP